MKILSQIYVGDNKFLLSLLGDTKDLSNLPTEYAADASRFLNTDSNAVYVYTSADGWEITEAGQMKDLPVVSATDNGKVLKVANGVWSIGTDESGGSLPANFPAEGAANANKFVGFDENGDYAAVPAPSGGSDTPTAETILTLEVSQMNSSTESGVTVYGVQIAYADLTTEQKEAIADLYTNNYTLFFGETEMEKATVGSSEMNVAIYRVNADDYGLPVDSTKPFFAIAIPKDSTTGNYYGVSISCGDDLSSETISFDGYITPDTSNAFYVNVPNCDMEQKTCGTPDKTIAEIQAAMDAGKNIYAKLDFDEHFMVVPLSTALESEGTVFTVGFTTYPGDGATLMFFISADGDSEDAGLVIVEAPIAARYFSFTIREIDGAYTATADNGDTNYGNIKDALDANIPAYANCAFGNLHLLMQFKSGDSSTETASDIFNINGSIMHFSISLTSSAITCDVVALSPVT